MKSWCLEMVKECLCISSMRLGVPFIAPRQLGAVESNLGRQFLPSVAWRTGQCPVPDFFPSTTKPTVGSQRAIGAPDMSGAHRTVRCPLLAVGLATCPAQIARPTVGPADRWPGRPLAHRTVRCTPDSPVNFSRTPSANSRERPLRPGQPAAPDTVRCTTGQSGAPDRNSLLAVHSQVFSSLLLSVSNT